MSVATTLIETLARPGLLGLVGRRLENAAQQDLEVYFAQLARRIDGANLGQVVTQNDSTVQHAVDMRLQNILRITSTDLQNILQTNIYIAMLQADKVAVFSEAAGVQMVDKLGLTGEEAAVYAAAKAAGLVGDINATTKQILADAVAQGITDKLGVDGTARLIRAVVTDMTASRSHTIATTEINDAMSEATLRKLKRASVAYKDRKSVV